MREFAAGLALGMVPAITGAQVETAKLTVEDAAPVRAGALELELSLVGLGATRAFAPDAESVGRRRTRDAELRLTATRGLGEHLDARVGVAAASVLDRAVAPDRGSGLRELDLGLKLRVAHGGALELAYLPGVIVPLSRTRDRRELRPGAAFASVTQRLAATWVGARWNASADLGWALPVGGRRGVERGVLDTNLGVGWHGRGDLQPVLELSARRELRDGARDVELVSLTTGAVVTPAPGWRIDIGVGRALWGRAADREVVATLNVALTR